MPAAMLLDLLSNTRRALEFFFREGHLLGHRVTHEYF